MASLMSGVPAERSQGEEADGIWVGILLAAFLFLFMVLLGGEWGEGENIILFYIFIIKSCSHQ